ncbi:hypothetical protein KO527_05165 [Pseudoalteromonas sp. C2R02]|uniref:hypothetical protein n=1 Tax=Pseudoalteromonas sp. C2R02 TaxID=2841565 RepID=UPI001C0939CA|nr:hypothetical protein [Pseudoalteromonas sp. C2R02]MBU2968737.1 hypothetical protein [Pseudoalteromonas sp. C2R02]
MKVTTKQATLLHLLKTHADHGVGKVKGLSLNVVYNIKTGVVLRDSDNEASIWHGRVITELVEVHGLESFLGDFGESFILTPQSKALDANVLASMTQKAPVTRVTMDRITEMANKYGYGFEFRRLVGHAVFTKGGIAQPKSTVSVKTLADKNLNEWEDILSNYIKSL